MRTFVVPDIHGRATSLEMLLTAAGVLVDGERVPEIAFDTDDACEEYQVVSIGDLANATLVDQVGDEDCLLVARDWFDKLILGNHESGYLFDNMGFNGYWPSPHLRSLYNEMRREGFVVPALLVGDTLLTHAGVHEYFDFGSAEEAYNEIIDVWDNYNEYRQDWSQKFYFKGNIEMPKALLLDAVSAKRGGDTPMGGLLWSDWSEQKNMSFNQVVGHTPIKEGPVLTQYLGTNIFHVNIDCAAKKGLVPTGVWLKPDGSIDRFVRADSLIVAD